MKIFINDREVEIFSGARLQDALMKYSLEEYHRVLQGEKILFDDAGNRCALDGEISGGERYILESADMVRSNDEE